MEHHGEGGLDMHANLFYGCGTALVTPFRGDRVDYGALEALIDWQLDSGVDALVARLCHVYGPTFTSANSRADAQFIRKALAGEDIVMKSTGSQVRSFCYVADAVSALLTLLVKGGRGQAYNVANRNSVASIRQYAETLADIAGVKVAFDVPPEAEKAGYTKITRAVLNPAKTEALGWRPQFDLREGLTATYRCCK